MKKNNLLIIFTSIIMLCVLLSCNVEPTPAITSFSLLGYPAYISGSTITQVVPPGTDLNDPLISSFTVYGIRVTIGGIEQVSGVTENIFNALIIYTVEMADGKTKDYTVTVKIGHIITRQYDISNFKTGIGLTDGGTLEFGVCFPQSIMAPLAGGCIVKENVYIAAIPSAMTLKIYDNLSSGYSGRLIHSQNVTPVLEWNDFTLNTPISINGSNLVAGFIATHAADENPCGMDSEDIPDPYADWFRDPPDPLWYHHYIEGYTNGGNWMIRIEILAP